MSQRICPGLKGKRCSLFLPAEEDDDHPSCSRCRGSVCSKTNPCDICRSWPDVRWAKFDRRQMIRERRRLSKLAKPPPSSPSGQGSLHSSFGDLDDSRVSDLESQISVLQQQTSVIPSLRDDVSKILAVLTAERSGRTESDRVESGRVGSDAALVTVAETDGRVEQVPFQHQQLSAVQTSGPADGSVSIGSTQMIASTAQGPVRLADGSIAVGALPLNMMVYQGTDDHTFLFPTKDVPLHCAQQPPVQSTPLRDETSKPFGMRSDNSVGLVLAPRLDGSIGYVPAGIPSNILRSPSPIPSPHHILMSPVAVIQPSFKKDASGRSKSKSSARSPPSSTRQKDRDVRPHTSSSSSSSSSRRKTASPVPVRDRSPVRGRSSSHSRSFLSSTKTSSSSPRRAHDADTSGRSSRLQEALNFSRLSEDEQADASYLQVQKWIQLTFPDLITLAQPAVKQYGSMAEQQLDTASTRTHSQALPWSPGVQTVKQQVQRIVTPFKLGKFVPPFASQLKFYKVDGLDRPSAPAKINSRLSSLFASGTVKHTVSVTEDELRVAETTARRSLQVVSSVDWQASTAARFINDLLARYEAAGGADTVAVGFQDIEALRRVMLSVSKSISQIVKESTANVANTVLKRRDALIKAIPSHVSEDSKGALRSTDVFSPQLFDEDTLTAVINSTQQSVSLSSSLKSVQLLDKLSSQATKTSSSKKPVYASDLPPRGPKNRQGNNNSNSRSSQRSDYSQKGSSRNTYPKKSDDRGGSGGTSGQSRFSGKGSPGGGRGGSQSSSRQ